MALAVQKAKAATSGKIKEELDKLDAAKEKADAAQEAFFTDQTDPVWVKPPKENEDDPDPEPTPDSVYIY